MNLKGTETEKNLQKALQGEALAHLKYQFYKSQLSKTSKVVENILDEIIHNEKEHGKIWFKLLHNGEFPSDEENLLDAIKGETYEAKEMYPDFAKVAYEEGFDKIGKLFEWVADIEGQHSDEFSIILKYLEDEELFEDDGPVFWRCLNCGHIHLGTKAPEECPVCNHPQKYFVRD